MSTILQHALVRAPDTVGNSVAARCHALALARSSFCYQPHGESS